MTPIQTKNILVLCTGNSCRSQMAHGYLNYLLKGKATIYSAGIETHGVNPIAIKVMKDDNIDISNHTSNNVDEYADIKFDYVITVCDNAKETCPYFSGKTKLIHKSFPDPASFSGTPEQVYNEFVKVRNMIKEFCINLTSKIINHEYSK